MSDKGTTYNEIALQKEIQSLQKKLRDLEPTAEMITVGWDAAEKYKNNNPLYGSPHVGLKLAYIAMREKALEQLQEVNQRRCSDCGRLLEGTAEPGHIYYCGPCGSMRDL